MQTRSYHVVWQPIADAVSWGGVAEIPHGPCRWDGAAGALAPAGDSSESIVFEAPQGSPPALLLIAPAKCHVCVNGQSAPLVSLVRVGDQITVDQQWRLHVTLFRPSPVANASAADAQRDCPVCRGRIASGGRIFKCGCSAIMHWDEAAGGLDCAAIVKQCPLCQTPVSSDEGYAWLPEGFHE